eukprot:g3963.t1
MQRRSLSALQVRRPTLSRTLQRSTCSTKRFSTASVADEVIEYDDDHLRAVLSENKTIAIIGCSASWNRPSYFAMSYMLRKGYRCIPVNPKVANSANPTILGQKCYASLKDIPDDIEIDIVDCFRNARDAPEIARQALERSEAKVLWMQLGVVSEEAKQIAEEGGLSVIMNRCPKIEFSRLFGELGWHGFNSNLISSRKRAIGKQEPSASVPADTCGFETQAIHAGSMPDPVTGARTTPIYNSTAFVFDDADHAASLFNLSTFGNIYGRLSNPTTAVLEEKLACLEGGKGTTCTASGHAAQLLALFTLLQPGDYMVCSNKLYGGSITQFGKTIKKFNWNCIFVNTDDPSAVKNAIEQADKESNGRGCKLLWAESLENPGGSVSDIQVLADIAHSHKIPLVIDNTMATPYLCRPFEHGADLVVHSTTKFISGHGNAMGGALIDSGNFDFAKMDPEGTRFPSLTAPEPAYHGLNFCETFGDLAFTVFGHAVGLRDLGTTMSPTNASLTITGLETLALRMERHSENALKVAEFLDQHDRVSEVSYSGLPSSPYFNKVQKYMRGGSGGSVFTFRLKGGYEAGRACVENATLFSHLANIGDTRSLILHPASTTHRQLTSEQRAQAGAHDNTVRLSIGLESVDDLIADLERSIE